MARTKTDQRGLPQHCGICGEPGHKRSFHSRGDTKRCTQCKRVLPRSAFYHHARTASAVLYCAPSCKACNVRQSARSYRASPRSRLLRLWHSAKSRCLASGIPFAITTADLYALFEAQAGRCYYTDRNMGHTGGPDSVSIERRDPALGYTVVNVVLACWAVNDAKRALSEEAFVALCGEVTAHRG